MRDIACVILAAGEGTRMKSRLPKVLHEVCGVPMVGHVLKAVEAVGIRRVLIVVGFQKERVQAYAGSRGSVILQEKQKGSGHALLQARSRLRSFSGNLLVLYGDTPLIRRETLEELLAVLRRSKADGVVLSAAVEDPAGYGRVIRNEDGSVARIVEEDDASHEEKRVREVNVGAYCFKKAPLFAALATLRPNGAKKEYYLTDVVEKLANRGGVVTACLPDSAEGAGINSRLDLSRAEKVMKERIVGEWMNRGVTIKDPSTTTIARDVEIGPDTVIFPCTVIEGPTRIGRNCRIGPFARIRGGVELGNGVYVGNFVEVVRSRIGDRSLAKHLTYLGDAEVGKEVNVGAGTITANFDGRSKQKTVIQSRAQVGSGTIFVAPVRLGAKAKTGAGAVLVRRQNVAAGQTVVGVPARVMKKKGRSK